MPYLSLGKISFEGFAAGALKSGRVEGMWCGTCPGTEIQSDMAIGSEAVARFKEGVAGLLPGSVSYEEGACFNFLVLDYGNRADRIQFPGYEKIIKLAFAGTLPFIGSPVRVVAVVPSGRRREVSSVPEEDLCPPEDGDAYYPGDVVLMYANSAFPKGFASLPPGRMRELVAERLRKDVAKLDMWGVYPVTMEAVPEIDGCLPEFVNPRTDAYLDKCFAKIRRTFLRREAADDTEKR